MISLFVFGIVLDKTQSYLGAARVLTTLQVILNTLGIWVIPSGNVAIAGTWGFIYGAALMPIFTVSLPFNTFITHPIPSDAANGIMLTGANVFATVGGLGGSAFFIAYWYPAVFTFIAVYTVACIASWLMKIPMKKNLAYLEADSLSKDEQYESKRLTQVSND